MWNPFDPACIDPSLDCRAVTFENPTGQRGGGGQACGGRKGAPSRRLAPSERVVLADLRGPGTLRHVWMTFPPAAPEVMRALWMEVFYDGEQRAQCLGAVSGLLRPTARSAGRICLGAHCPRRRAAASTPTCRCRSTMPCAWS